MNIRDRLKYSWGVFTGKIQPGPVTGYVPLAMAGDYAYDQDPSRLLQNDMLYTKIGWVFSATNAAAGYGAAQKYHVKQLMGEESKDIPNHPFETLLRKPNPLMSRAEFLTASFSYYIIAQNCYWWINDGGLQNGEPLELWIIPPGQIIPMTDSRLFIKYYQYTPYSGTILQIPVAQIVHFKWFNPCNPFQGNGLWDTVKFQVSTDYGTLRNQAAIQSEANGAAPGILAFSDTIIDGEWTKIKLELSEAAKMMKRYLPLRGVGAGGVQWLPNALSDREMQVIEKRAFTRDEVFQIIAPGYLNMVLPNVTEANAKTGKATFAEFCIYPMLNNFSEKIVNDLLPRYGEDLTGEFDEVRTKDRVLELSEQEAYAKTHTIAEVRKKYYQDEPLGDERDSLLIVQVTAQTGVTPPANPNVIDGSFTDVTQQQPGQQPAPQLPAPMDESTMENDTMPMDAVQGEMKKWRRVVRKALKAGKAIPDFVTDIIPLEQAEAIRENLKAVKVESDIDGAFVVERVDSLLVLAHELKLAREAIGD